MTEVLFEALRLIEYGSVLPAFGVRQRDEHSPYRCACGQPACASPGKHPIGGLVPRGLKDATRDPERVRRWWPSSPTAKAHNLALATGSMVVVDVDGDEGEQSFARLEAEHGSFDDTWQSFTGNGRHIFFRAPPGRIIANSASKLGACIDVRGANGYAIMPPSRHVSGRTYSWSINHHPDEVVLATVPAWMIDLCAAPVAATGSIGARFDPAAFVGGGIFEGSRNARLTSVCGYLMRKLPPSDAHLVLDLVWGLNLSKCMPPLPRGEVEKIVGSIAGRELRRRAA